MPGWLRVVLATLGIVAGVVLVLRPFTSVVTLLLTLGVAVLVAALAEAAAWWSGTDRTRWGHLLLAVLLLALGAVLLFWPSAGVDWLVIAFGVVLLALGTLDLVQAVARSARRIEHALSGSANVIFGVLALSWADVTVIVAGVLFGVWLLVSSLRLLLGARWRHRAAAKRAFRATGVRITVSALSLAVAIALALVGMRLTGTPVPDAFYDAPEASAIPNEPGQLLRAEPFTAGIPDGSTAWRVLYTTTRDDGVPAIASGLVVVPTGVTDPPIIAWAHGTNGQAVGCAPTLQADPLKTQETPMPVQALQSGWAIVATDYVGLGADAPHPYMVGEPSARSVLDAVRAADQLSEVSLGEQVAVWGHSQGGGAGLWAGGIAEAYAPELQLVGVAVGAPASDVPALVAQLATSMAGTVVGPLVLAGYEAAYPEIRTDAYVRPEATLLVEETIARCWTDPSMIVSILEAGVADGGIWSTDPNSGPMGKRLAENVPNQMISVPVLIGQGLADDLVLPASQQKYVDQRCAAGQALDYQTYPGLGHMGVVQPGSGFLSEITQWTADRFAGKPAPNTCGAS